MNADFIKYILEKGGPTIIPLLFLSILAVSTIVERFFFWTKYLIRSETVLTRIMENAARNWDSALKIAREYQNHSIGAYLFAPLRLHNPEPEVFHLSLESAADEQLALMRRGDKILEAVIALSPLLGLLGTVLGLIGALQSIQASDLGTSATAGLNLGIGESLISTAVGLVVAIISLAFYRLFQGFWFQQVRVFRKAGSDLEVIYRQRWLDLEERDYTYEPEQDLAEETGR